MASSLSNRHAGILPPKYRRRTYCMDHVFQSGMGRHETAPTHKWMQNLPDDPPYAMHRSVGDLTVDPQPQSTYPRLQSDFYQQLHRKYPRAFQRRQAGRKLFNAQHHVRFQDEINADHNGHHIESDNGERPIVTNWDKEVGHYLNDRSRSQDRLATGALSECSGSVLSVTDRLRLNSQTLNKLLNESSPLRRKFEEERQQYDSGTENEKEFHDYYVDRCKERSRSRNKQRRVLQRKIDNKQNSGTNSLPSYSYTRERTSKSASPVSRQHDMSVILANSDLKIDTLLEKMANPDSPPDSAIGIDTPSVQSFVLANKGLSLDQYNQYVGELPDANGLHNEHELNEHQLNLDIDDIESSPGSSASTCIRKTRNADNDVLQDSNRDMEMIDKGESSSTLFGNERSGPGLLQLYTEEHEQVDSTYRSLLQTDEVCDSQRSTNVTAKSNCSEMPGTSANREPLEQLGYDNVTLAEMSGGANGVDVGREGVENNCYHADDEDDACEDVITEANQHFEKTKQKGFFHRDSDVDSGIGQSSGEKAATLPPRGRAKKREITSRPQPMKADHSILPLQSDVDSCILDEVTLTQSAYTLPTRGRKLTHPDVDDTDSTLGVITQNSTAEEQTLARKYRQKRSPSPYILTNTRQASASRRPHSAPNFTADQLEMRLVDISLSNTHHGFPSGSLAKTNDDIVIDKNDNLENVVNSCQTSDIVSVSSSVPVEYVVKDDHIRQYKDSDIDGEKSLEDQSDTVVSPIVSHRKCSITSGSSLESSLSHTSGSVDDNPTAIHNPKSNNQSHGNVQTVTAKPIVVEVVTDSDPVNSGAGELIHTQNHVDENVVPSYDATSCEDINQSEPYVHGVKGRYKPSATSPRNKDKQLKLKGIMKQKKENSNPSGADKHVQRIYAKDRHVVGEVSAYRSHRSSSQSSENSNENIHIPRSNSNSSRYENGKKIAIGGTSVEGENTRVVDSAASQTGSSSPAADSDSVEGFLTGASLGTVTATPVEILSVPTNSQSGGAMQSGHRERKHSNPAPAKPARTKHRKAKSADVSMTQPDVVLDNSNVSRMSGELPRPASTGIEQSPSYINMPSNSIGMGARQKQPVNQQLLDGGGKRSSKAPSEIEVLPPQESTNLVKSKKMSASKNSLFEKMGGLKSATKGKFKAIKKAMSLEQGMDTVGGQKSQSDSGSTGFLGIKKAPSLKSITSLFGRKRKKKSYPASEDETARRLGSTLSINSDNSGNLSKQQHQHWASCHSLSTIESPSHKQPIKMSRGDSQPIGKLQSVNSDGTHVIQLNKPSKGPLGFFIAKGNAKYRHGIFVSRFSEVRPEKAFAGLLGVGDEILEINGHLVCDLSQDAVYSLIGASPIVVMKIFPFIARKDV